MVIIASIILVYNSCTNVRKKDMKGCEEHLCKEGHNEIIMNQSACDQKMCKICIENKKKTYSKRSFLGYV